MSARGVPRISGVERRPLVAIVTRERFERDVPDSEGRMRRRGLTRLQLACGHTVEVWRKVYGNTSRCDCCPLKPLEGA